MIENKLDWRWTYILAVLFLIGVQIFHLANGATYLTDSWYRLFPAALFIFILPGAIWGELLHIKSHHLLEFCALSFALTLAIDLCILPLVVYFGLQLQIFLYALIAISFLGCGFLAIQTIKGRQLTFLGESIAGLFSHPYLNTFLILSIVGLSMITYRWGDNPCEECLLHITVVRSYFEMPLSLEFLGYLKGNPPPNLIHGWEFLLASWSKLSETDPFYVFFRARFVIPILGLSAFYLLINGLFQNASKSIYIFIIGLFMCLGNFAYLDHYTDWIADPYRGVMHFWGTVHHGDAAVDVMLPLATAMLIIFLKKGGITIFLLMAAVLIQSFLWHPRIFFITESYIGVFILIFFLLPLEKDSKWKLGKRLLATFGAYFSINLFFLLFAIRPVSLAKTLGVYPNEIDFKLAAWHSAVTTNWNQFFHFFYYFGHFKLWLLTTALSILIILWKGNRSEKTLAVFLSLYWFFVTCWSFSLRILEIMTYSQFSMGSISFFHLPVIVLNATALLLLIKKCYRYVPDNNNGPNNIKAFFQSLFIFGAIFYFFGSILRFYWDSAYPAFAQIAYLFSVLLTILIADNIYFYFKNVSFLGLTDSFEGALSQNNQRTFTLFFAACVFLFLLPILNPQLLKNANLAKNFHRKLDFHSSMNPFNMSPEIIQYIHSLDKMKNIYNDPLGKYPVNSYAGIYTTSQIPYTSDKDTPSRKLALQGKYPIFNPHPEQDQDIEDYLAKRNVDYILVEPNFYDVLYPYFKTHSALFKISFINHIRKEMVVQFLGPIEIQPN